MKKTQKAFAPNAKKRSKGQDWGKRFEGEILDALKRENPFGWSQRIADKVGNVRRGNKRFGAKTPADMIACFEWGDLLFECKSTIGTSLAFSDVRPHQFRWLKKFNRVSDHHMGAVVVMFANLDREPGRTVNRRAFIIDVRTFARLKKEYKKGKRKFKSINRQELFDGTIPALECEWVRGEGWHIGTFRKKGKEGFERYE